jgi:hypothetical protein
MTTSPDTIAARDSALRKIGRNLANFQKLEAMLKFVHTRSRFSSTASGARENFKRHATDVRGTGFGELVERTPKVLSGQNDEPPDGDHLPWISVSISSSEFSADVLRDWRREMRRVVEDRNQLVHHMLANFDPDSLDACSRLGAELDAQHERTMQVFGRVKSFLSTVQSMHQTLAENAEEIVEAMLSAAPPGDT